MIRFFYEEHFDSWMLIPTISITAGRCECCDQIGAWLITLDWLWASAGVQVEFGVRTDDPTH